MTQTENQIPKYINNPPIIIFRLVIYYSPYIRRLSNTAATINQIIMTKKLISITYHNILKSAVRRKTITSPISLSGHP